MGSWFYKDGKGELFKDDVCPDGYTDSPSSRANPTDVEAPKTKRKYTKKVKPEVEKE